MDYLQLEPRITLTKIALAPWTKSHYHGTSLSLFQLSSKTIVGINRDYNKFLKVKAPDSKRVRDLIRFYTDTSFINNQPETFFFTVPTTNVSQELGDRVDFDSSVMADFDWLEHVASSSKSVGDIS